ncbi:MAG TPA: 5'-nucleotidase C-terminal domain-containing protein [Gemmatimonadaceae bacterium]|nr:5'-nucleotidase C-terminal domain-containing protein [Gemmatimonadaceae bacterium]
MKNSFVWLPAVLFAAGCSSAPIVPSAGSTPASGSIDLIVLSTTDVHGRIRGWDYYADSAESIRGLSREATIVDSVRAANPGRVLLVDAGDLLQGNPFAYIANREFKTNPIIAAMNSMRYDAAAIGNHEYNYGVPYLESAVAQARFPMLSANTYKMDGKHAFKSWTIVERSGAKIGIVGATTPGVMVWDAEHVKGKLRLGDIVPAVRTAVNEVRASGANVIVVTVHSGLNEPSSYDTASTGLPSENVAGRIASEIPGIDLIVYGHSHKEQKDLHIGSTLLVQPKNWAQSLGAAHLILSKASGSWKVTSSHGETIQAARHPEEAGVLAASAATHKATLAYANMVIGTTKTAWRGDSARLKDTPLIDFLLDVERKAAGTDLASTAAFTLDGALPAGNVTVAKIAQLYPYDNTLRAVRLTGKQLREYLEFSSRFYTGALRGGAPATNPEIPGYNFDIVSGVDYTLDLTKPIGSRVTSLIFKGKPVVDGDSFTMALNNYRQTGGGGYTMLRDAPVIYDKQEEIRQLLIDEVRARKELRQADYFHQNWSLVYPGGTSSGPRQPQTLPSGTPRLRIIGTNDLHGALEPRADANGVLRGGAAYAAAVIEKVRNECAPNCETILVDGGDLFQGTVVSNLSYGRPVVEYYNKIGYTAAALGNHEFDWGVDTLRARIRQANFAFLSANLKFADGRDVPWIRADTIVVRGKTKVGIIGISTPETKTSTMPAIVRPYRFDDPATVIDARARDLRSRGADVIVVVAHEGGFCNTKDGVESCSGDIFDVANKITQKVDVIVSGHTHSLLNTRANGIPIVQARTAGQAVDVVDIPLDDNGKPSGPAVADVRSVPTASLTAFAPVDSIVNRASKLVAPIANRRVATIKVPLTRKGSQYPLGNLVADAQRWAGKGDIAIMNNHGIRANLPAGEITYGKLFEIQPFANTLYRIRMTGAQVREYLEKLVDMDELQVHVSGISVGYNPDLGRGSRITSLRLPMGKTLNESAFYEVVTNNFIASGGSNMGPPAGSKQVPLGITDLDALINYLKTLRSPIAPPSENRIFIAQ